MKTVREFEDRSYINDNPKYVKLNPEWAPLPAGFKMSEERRPKPAIVEFKTFRDWSDAGYQILKGSKHVKRDSNGVALFSSEQVSYTRSPDLGQDEDFEVEDYDPDLPGNPADYGDS